MGSVRANVSPGCRRRHTARLIGRRGSHPPFIFKDPTYIYIVIGIVVLGTVLARRVRFSDSIRCKFSYFLLLIDPVGIAAFTIIGAKVAIITDLYWFWIPICAAATRAGGGVLLDICTGREPRTFTGEIYEELAIIGGLVLIALLSLANHVSDVETFIVVAIIFTFALVYGLRIFVVQRGLRAPRLIG
jgi:NitT/TauT family transport system substrate-binding protein